MWVRVIFAILLLNLPTGAFAQTEKRIALLIGNQGYADTVGPLQNPHKDIALVGRALTEVGFNVLEPLKDATRDDMLFGIYELASRLRQAGAGAVGFLYYTGHGVSVGVDNVLVPKNVRSTSDAELDVRGVKLGEILDILKRGAPDAVAFGVLHACRNNIRGKKGAKGFVPVSEYRTGVVLAFATAAGETASDEGTTSGPYAAALAEEIVKPGHNDQTVFNAVRARVVAATRGQTPWTHDGLVGERIVFKVPAPEPGIGRPPGTPAPGGAIEIVRICREVESMTSLSMLGVLERQHTGTPAADCISARIGELKAAQAAAAKAAEERAKADAVAKRRAEEEAQAEAAARKRAEHEARAKAEAERQRLAMLEQQRQDEARKTAVAEAARKGCDATGAMAPSCVFRDCPTCPQMVVVSSGSFTMGSHPIESGRYDDSEAQVRVSIAAPFAVGKYAVTFDEWDACIAEGGCNGYKPADQGWGRGRHPVINVNWDDAKAYASWLSHKTGKTYRLLSEAEREYVTR